MNEVKIGKFERAYSIPKKENTRNTTVELSRSFKIYSIFFVQLVLRFVNKIYLQFLAKIEIIGQRKINLDGPLIIVSNHKSYYDPLLVDLALKLGFSSYPLRFMGKDELFVNLLLKIFFYSIGSFPSFKGKGLDKSLFIPKKIIEQSGTVVFFPEGECIRNDSLGNPKIGVAVLALAYPNANILPIAIKNSYHIKNFFYRPKVKVSVGRPMRLKDLVEIGTATVESTAKAMMQEVARLYGEME